MTQAFATATELNIFEWKLARISWIVLQHFGLKFFAIVEIATKDYRAFSLEYLEEGFQFVRYCQLR